MTEQTGNVSTKRWATLVREGRQAVATLSRCQWLLGDIALEIEPMQPHGGAHGADVYDTLRNFAEEIGEEFVTLVSHRAVAHAWPTGKRADGSSWTVHRILSALPEPERFHLIKHPPSDGRTGQRRWTCDAAARAAGRAPAIPRTSGERVNRIHDLAADDIVAAAAVSDLLRRPDVAHRVISDPTTRHLLNRAQVDRSRQVEEQVRHRMPVVQNLEHSIEVITLLGSCAAFVSAVTRVMPRLNDQPLSDKGRGALHEHLDRVRAAADWCDTVINTGDMSMDAQLSALLRGGDQS